MARYLLMILISVITLNVFGQKASDVLENGNPIKKGKRIFLKYDLDEKKLKIDDVRKDQDVDFITIEDSIIYLSHKNAINVYIRPLNPLNLNFNSETSEIIDPINQAAETAFINIHDGLQKLIVNKDVNQSDSGKENNKIVNTNDIIECQGVNDLIVLINRINVELNKSQKEVINKIFTSLKNLTFEEEQSTIESLNKANAEIAKIEVHFNELDKLVDSLKSKVESVSCDPIFQFIIKYILDANYRDFKLSIEEQKKRLTNLNTSYKLVKEMQVKASKGGGTNQLKWCVPLGEVSTKDGKISISTISVKENGFKLSESNEIVKVESKELLKRTIRFRRFQRFVPEVSIGTAYTFFKYKTFGTTTDLNGNQIIAPPVENAIKNINITSMINFNYYAPNTQVHPLLQIGLGLNSEIPTLLAGAGLRFRVGQRRIAITGGIALTWVKELDKLKVGDQISGTDDIEKDLEYQFTTPKAYFGIQYNF